MARVERLGTVYSRRRLLQRRAPLNVARSTWEKASADEPRSKTSTRRKSNRNARKFRAHPGDEKQPPPGVTPAEAQMSGLKKGASRCVASRNPTWDSLLRTRAVELRAQGHDAASTTRA